MTAPFMPMAFKAEDGGVTFEGRKLSDMRAVALRQRLVTLSMELKSSQRAAGIYWAFMHQLMAAMRDAREQRRKSFHIITGRKTA